MTTSNYFRLLTPDNCVITFIDHQPQMIFGVQSIDRQLLVNNTTGLAKTAKLFNVPTVLSTISEKTFSGPILSEIQNQFPDQKPIDRTNMNAWEDERFVEAIEHTDSRKIVMSGLWTEICVAFPALSAMEAGYEVYVVADCCGDVNRMSHDMAMQRMIQAGAVPVTWLQVMCEFQRDWAHQETYEGVADISREHAGAYGQGVVYAHTMLGEHAAA